MGYGNLAVGINKEREEMEEQEIIVEAMRLLGRRKSERKAKASKENGKKGGRPRKKLAVGINGIQTE